MDAVEQKIRVWVSNIPEKEKQNQFYCFYWAETGPDDTICTDPTCIKFFKSKEQIVAYLLDIYCFEDDGAEDVMFYNEEKHESGWDVYIDEVKED